MNSYQIEPLDIIFLSFPLLSLPPTLPKPLSLWQIKEIFNLLISSWKGDCYHIGSSPSLPLDTIVFFHVGIFFFSVCSWDFQKSIL